MQNKEFVGKLLQWREEMLTPTEEKRIAKELGKITIRERKSVIERILLGLFLSIHEKGLPDTERKTEELVDDISNVIVCSLDEADDKAKQELGRIEWEKYIKNIKK